MNLTAFAEAAEFPGAWLKYGLLDGPFFVQQAIEFELEYGSSKPRGGTEHWRYAAFLSWLRMKPDASRVEQLLEAALADPDPPMAGNVIKELVENPLCTEQMLVAATRQVAANRDYYVRPEELQSIFSSSRVRQQ